ILANLLYLETFYHQYYIEQTFNFLQIIFQLLCYLISAAVHTYFHLSYALILSLVISTGAVELKILLIKIQQNFQFLRQIASKNQILNRDESNQVQWKKVVKLIKPKAKRMHSSKFTLSLAEFRRNLAQ